jgi:hypothetical protein
MQVSKRDLIRQLASASGFCTRTVAVILGRQSKKGAGAEDRRP